MHSNDDPTDDDPKHTVQSPLTVDAHGHAALLLVESLIHGMIERSQLSSADAIEIIEGAANVQGQIAEAADGAGATMWQAQALLERMSGSLALDLGGTPTRTQ
ncbi:MAG: hypothetical protein EOO77_04030 [Oxalobacteraceae bacterium]|nr:MAG: hypothetical protein EOO77_04030 [Oxalobacteraceae bacterium]